MPDSPPALRPPEKWRHLKWHWVDTPSGLEPWMWVDERWLPAGCKFPFEMETYTGCVYRSVCDPDAIGPDPDNERQRDAVANPMSKSETAGMLTEVESTALPPLTDEREALEELLRLGRAALDEACIGDDCEDAHGAFRDSIADWPDDTLWRLLRRVKL